MRAKKYELNVWPYTLRFSDSVVRTVVFEDRLGLIGVFVAATGLFLSEILGTSRIRLRRC